jgi:hypothetical protein
MSFLLEVAGGIEPAAREANTRGRGLFARVPLFAVRLCLEAL